jgi:hypothetical protein
MQTYIFWTFLLAVLALLSVGIAVFVRAYLSGTTPAALLFRQKNDRRLEVVDHANVDSRRKLILIRRDDVEHLVMTGGPVDLVIETGIAAPPRPQATETSPQRHPTIFRRPPILGQRPTGPVDPDPGSQQF